jgi:CheY-like chemotaxis protein
MVKAVMQAVEASPDINLARELLKLSIPEINQAMASVEGMVQDIMQIGTEAKPVLETVCPKQIILNALKELFRVYPDADVSIESDFRNTGYISIDTTRFSRVFSNILGNALQAMQGKGTLWFKTSNFEDRVLFRIGNSGSIIPQENLARLFDAFFTSGKKGGTGLGLAIAKKIVEMHGGFIGCHSEKTNKYPDGYVEFSFSVPHSEVTADLQSRSCSSIPSHSKQFYEEFARQKELVSSSPPVDEREAELTREILSKIALSEPPLPILVVDDEAIYRNNIESLLKKTPQINSKIAIIWAKNANDALAKVREYDPLLVIQDIDLGLDSESGIEVINRMRESGFKGQICVHSNRFLPTDNKEALDAGAGHILPKPMTGIHLLKLIATALDGTNTP